MTAGRQKILLGCFEVPGYGGASTAGYHLFGMMQRDRHDVHFLNIISREDGPFMRYTYGAAVGNPAGRANVENCFLRGDLFDGYRQLKDQVDALGPDLMIGIGYIAALLLKRAAPQRPLIFMTTGSTQAKVCIEKGWAADGIALRRQLEGQEGRAKIYHEQEKAAADRSDLILTHSEPIQYLTTRFFPNLNGQIYPQVISWAEWICDDARAYAHLAQPFDRRDVDLLFVANTWDRGVKNYPLVEKICAAHPQLKITVVGTGAKPVDGVTYTGVIRDRSQLFALMGRSKAVACPSLFDAAPGILYEASILGCNAVASKNCGNWRLCHSDLLADPFTPDQFAEKIDLAQRRKYDDNLDLFLQSQDYRALLDIIAAF